MQIAKLQQLARRLGITDCYQTFQFGNYTAVIPAKAGIQFKTFPLDVALHPAVSFIETFSSSGMSERVRE